MTVCKLGEMKKGQAGRIIIVRDDADGFSRRLMEIGLLEGSEVEVVHEAPFGGDPMAVRVRGALIALRRLEANQIEVEV